MTMPTFLRPFSSLPAPPHQGLLLLLAVLVLAGCDTSSSVEPPDEPEEPVYDPTPYELAIPESFPPMEIPEDNPMTVEGVNLGRRLFHDPILSGDNSQSCASCHLPANAFAEPRRFSIGIDGSTGTRNAPNLTNVGWVGPELFWDGRVHSIEEQATKPVENPIEMNQDWNELLGELKAHETYPDLFFEAFGTREITQDHVVMAIAQFERTFISGDAKYDRYLRGEATLTAEEARGMELFFTEQADCFHCHGEPLFTDFEFRNIGLDEDPQDRGRFDVTGDLFDNGKFKTPTLRNVEFTAPFMHDGRFATLEEAVQHYNDGGNPGFNVDPLMRSGVGLGLSDEDVDALVAFLKTLSEPAFVTNPDFESPL